MSPFQDADTRANLFYNRIPHLVKKRAGKLNGISLADAGGKSNHLSAPLNHEFRPGNSPFAGTSAAGNKSHNFNRAGFLKSATALPGSFKIGISRAHIFSLLTSNNPCFHHKSLLLRELSFAHDLTKIKKV
jgi:hypothetical protein